jgi:hypothetical protein
MAAMHRHHVKHERLSLRRGRSVRVYRCACGARKIDTITRYGDESTTGWREPPRRRAGFDGLV